MTAKTTESSTIGSYLMAYDRKYVASADTAVVSGKLYYTRSGSSAPYTYTRVSSPTGNPSTSNYYEWGGEFESTLSELVRIKSYPDLGGTPNTIEITDLTDRMQRFVMGVQSSDALEFTCNYLPDKYETIAAMSDEELAVGPDKFAIYFGDTAQGSPTGSFGKFSFEGTVTVYVNSGDVDAAREMTVTIVPSTKVTADVSGS